MSLSLRLQLLVQLTGAGRKSFTRPSSTAAGIVNSPRPLQHGSTAFGDKKQPPLLPLAPCNRECWDLWQADGLPIKHAKASYHENLNFEAIFLTDRYEQSVRGSSSAEFGALKLRPPPRIRDKGGVEKCSRLGIKDPLVATCSRICTEGQLTDAVEALSFLVHRASVVPYGIFYSVLKRCIIHKDLVLGRRVHALIINSGFESNVFLANHVLRMYATQGRLEEAMQVFSRVPVPDTFIWNSIISAYSEHGQPKQAMELYLKMRRSTVKPNNYIFAGVLKACANAADLDFGKKVHADILASVDEADAFVCSCLVDMYAKCGRLDDARSVFDTFPIKNVVVWTTMIAGYADHGLGQEALSLYESMQQEGIIPDEHTFACLIKSCATIGDLHQGKQIHAQIQERGMEGDTVVSNKLIQMYAKCGRLEDVQRLFDRLSMKDVGTWNVLFAVYLENGFGQEAIELYARMKNEGIPANRSTFACLLQTCSSLGALHLGKEVHASIQEQGLETDVVIGNCLVDMYAKCGRLEDARKVFDSLPSRDVVTWTTMLTRYAQHGHGQEALDLYASMQEERITLADHFTFACLLKACAVVKALQQGQQLHAQIQERGLESDVVVGTSLVDMYAKCGSLTDACRVFDCLPRKNVVTWNAMIAGYVQHGLCHEAITLYASMKEDSAAPANNVTYVCLLQACASIAALQQGKQLHTEIRNRDLEADVVVGTSLVDMYAKCGSLEDARRVFDRLCIRNVVTWNALLNGYAHHGNSHMAIQCFKEMQHQGVQPDEATFVSLIVACSHDGLVNEGLWFFRIMNDHGIVPSVTHYNCVVDLLGRSGQLNEAERMLSTMPFKKDIVGWMSLLSACKTHVDIDRARRCFDCLVTLEPNNAAAYVLLGNIYATAGRWWDVLEIESLRKSAGAWKKPAKACIEVHSKVHEFTVGEERSDLSSKLRSTNLRLRGEGGHVPHTELVLKAVSESEKEDALCGHAEKLALAYGLINTPDGATLLVTKNLRMCNDCHSGTKIMSRLEKREIIVKDAHRVHRFVDGACSCGDRH